MVTTINDAFLSATPQPSSFISHPKHPFSGYLSIINSTSYFYFLITPTRCLIMVQIGWQTDRQTNSYLSEKYSIQKPILYTRLIHNRHRSAGYMTCVETVMFKSLWHLKVIYRNNWNGEPSISTIRGLSPNTSNLQECCKKEYLQHFHKICAVTGHQDPRQTTTTN